MVGLRHATHATAIAAMATNNAGPRLVSKPALHVARVVIADSGKSSTSRPCSPSEITAQTRPILSAPIMIRPPLLPCPIQAAKNTPPTPTNRPR
jgi:hypothetical protein